MIQTTATKLLTAQLHVLCILIFSHLARSARDIFPKDEFQQEANRPSVQRQLNKIYFNLRLYWERGYRWQESSGESFWCMACVSHTCERDSSIEVKWCDRDDPRQQWYFDRSKIRSRGNKSMCLQRIGRSIKLRPCTNSKYQRWSELPKDKPFELQIPGYSDKCATQHHHPKDNEEIYMESCKLAVVSDTDKWVVY